MTSIAIRGKDSVVTVCQRKVPDKLIVAESVSNIFNISDACGAIIVGNLNDAKFVVSWLRQQSADFKNKFAYEAPIHMLAKRLGQNLQKYSQYAGIRPFCVSITLVGCDVSSDHSASRSTHQDNQLDSRLCLLEPKSKRP